MSPRIKTINLNTQDGVELSMFMDNQPHVQLLDIEAGDLVNVTVSFTDSLKFIQLLQVCNAVSNLRAYVNILTIPYLMGARYDRHMVYGDSFDLKVFGELINSCGFRRVHLVDVHSEVALHIINNSENVIPDLVASHPTLSKVENPLFLCPDKGAVHRIEYLYSHADIMYCNKVRSRDNSRVDIIVPNPERAVGRDVFIIDDICDGGRTFMGISSQISPDSVHLFVTHGLFSYGVSELLKFFDTIVTSDTLPLEKDTARRVDVVKLSLQ